MITLARIINIILAVALGVFALAIIGLLIAMTGGADEIPSHRNRDIIGDGAWDVPSPESALVSDMPQREWV